MNIALIPNPYKPDAVEAAQTLLKLLSNGHSRVAILGQANAAELAAFKPDLVVVLGGDGSILATVQLLDSITPGPTPPVVGINFGKLGYLAAFSLDEFLQYRELIVSGKARATQRMMLHAAIYPYNGAEGILSPANLRKLTPRVSGIALNDVVINSGDPFRMIELEAQINEESAVRFRSDGVIVSTASGSTGYNLSAGGPLVSPMIEAMVLTPICPYSLSFRPVVLPADNSIVICPRKLNAGSKVSIDGQITHPIRTDECLLIRRNPAPLTLVENPAFSHWQMLAQKLHWARSPRK